MSHPDRIELIPDRSAPEASQMAYAGFTLADLTRLGVSPIAFKCNEDWKRIISILADKDGYAWEWASTDPSSPFWGDLGEAVMEKVR